MDCGCEPTPWPSSHLASLVENFLLQGARSLASCDAVVEAAACDPARSRIGPDIKGQQVQEYFSRHVVGDKPADAPGG